MVPSAKSLPDLVPMINGVLAATHSSDCSVTSQFIRQCVPLKRRTKRAQREIVWTSNSLADMQVLVRCAFGTFLGLYPASSKTLQFHNRVAINALMHTLLVSPGTLLAKFFNSMSHILRLSIMEYCCFAISSFAPGLLAALNKKKQFPVFCRSIHGVCDTFRSELNMTTLCAGDVWGVWQRLEQIEHGAQTLFDRCSRAFRTVIAPVPVHVLTSAPRRRIAKHVHTHPTFLADCMEMHVCSNKYVFAAINAWPASISTGLDEYWEVQNNVRIRELSAQITMKQLARVYMMHPTDDALRRHQGRLARKHARVCVCFRLSATHRQLTRRHQQVSCKCAWSAH
jgi:hypothetical protein